MSRRNKQTPIRVTESKSAWVRRGSPFDFNGEKHQYTNAPDFTTNSGTIIRKHGQKFLEIKDNLMQTTSLVEVGTGKIVKIGNQSINSSYPEHEIKGLLSALPQNGTIVEYYATHFCHSIVRTSGDYCFGTKFHNDHARAQEVCMKCGNSKKMVQYLSTNSMNSEGVINKHATNHAPANTSLGSLPSGGSRKPSHLKSFYKIGEIISGIAEAFRRHMYSVDYVEKHAKKTLSMYYESIHGATNDRDNDNIPLRFKNGQAAIAAACFFASKLHIEKHQKNDLPYTMSSIVEYAEQENFIKTKVTPVIVTDICKTLETNGIIEKGLIPELVTVSLDWRNENTDKRFRRMELFKDCDRKTIHFAKNTKNEMVLQETDQGALQVKTLKKDCPAYMSGLREQDYLMSLQGKEIPPEETLEMFVQSFTNAKESKGNKFELCVQRQKSRKRKR
jgi:hypothetical protein